MMANLWRLWSWFAGILLPAMIISYGIMRVFEGSGPVVEVVKGPPPGTIYAPYKGTITYEVTTRRLHSCPGTLRTEYRRFGIDPEDPGADQHVVSTFSPVMPSEIRKEFTTLVQRILPESVYPGRWTYRETLNSRCPLRPQVTDVIADFKIEVVPGSTK